MIKVTYLDHSGFLVELEDAYFYLIIIKADYRRSIWRKDVLCL